MENNNKRHYDAQDIKVLTGLEPVRTRPGMYIGSTGPRGLHHLVYEVVDNSIDEALAGICDHIVITLDEDGSASIEDNGSGIPTGIHPQTGKSTVETVLTVLHAGGKFDNNAYKVSGGLHGVGVSVVNALSEWLIATVKRHGKIHEQRFARGKAISELEILGDTEETGTTIQFLPDKDIFDTVEFDFDTLEDRMREMAFLNKGVKLVLRDERGDKEREKVFKYDGGIIEMVKYLNKSKNPIVEDIIYIDEEKDGQEVEIALQYTDGYSENIISFANNIHTPEG